MIKSLFFIVLGGLILDSKVKRGNHPDANDVKEAQRESARASARARRLYETFIENRRRAKKEAETQ